MRIHLISFGDDVYKNQKVVFKNLAYNSSFFDSVKIFTPQSLSKKFRIKYADILKIQKGAGYWIWKPHILKRVLDQLPDNDILIYCDAGCLINVEGKERFMQYIEILKNSSLGSLAFELTHKEYRYTKQEVFDYFNCSDEIKKSNQLVGGILLFRKCNHSTSLIESWLKVLDDSPGLFTDEKESTIQKNGFIDHRHDQSIFSVIRKKYGTELLPDETYFNDFLEEGKAFPFWAARIK